MRESTPDRSLCVMRLRAAADTSSCSAGRALLRCCVLCDLNPWTLPQCDGRIGR